MSNAPLMPKATAVWLVDNTALTFDQVAAVRQTYNGIGDRNITVRVVLHGVADYAGDFNETAVILFE